SDPTALPASERPCLRALSTQRSTESTRLLWPAPMASVRSPEQNTMALLFTWRVTRHANSSAFISAGVGARFETMRQVSGSVVPALHEQSARDALPLGAVAPRGRELALEHAQVLLLGQDRERPLAPLRRDGALDEEVGDERARDGLVDGRVERVDAAERRDGI